jgi:hypothetical protein
MTAPTRDSRHMVHISMNSDSLPIPIHQLHHMPHTLRQPLRPLHTIMVRRNHTRMPRITRNMRRILLLFRSTVALQPRPTSLTKVSMLHTPVEQTLSLLFRRQRLHHICLHHQAGRLRNRAPIEAIL